MLANAEADAFSSPESVKEIARAIGHVSDAVHIALRRLSTTILSSESPSSYALLTEEYALRARANILTVDANRFVFQGFEASHATVAHALKTLETKLENCSTIDALSGLVVDTMLFANAITSKNPQIVAFLFRNLRIHTDKPARRQD